MKKAILFFVFFVLIRFSAISQNVGINTTGATPNLSAVFDVDISPVNNRGALLPRVTFAERTGINFNPMPAIAQGLTVYQTNAGGEGEGYYYNTSLTTTAVWEKLFSVTTGWSVTGNAGLNAANNFLGTTDNVPLVLRTNSLERMRIDTITGNVGIGTAGPVWRLEVNRDIAVRGDSTDNVGSVNFVNTTSGAWWHWTLRGNSNDNLEMHVRPTGIGVSNIPLVMTTSGNVGIGTTVPTEKLELADSAGVAIRLLDTGSHSFRIFTPNNEDRLSLQGGGGDSTGIHVIGSSGNVGIGTTIPLNMLHIVGSTGTDGLYIKTISATPITSPWGIRLENDVATSTGKKPWGMEADWDGNLRIATTVAITPIMINQSGFVTIKGPYASPQTLIGYDGANGIFFHAQGSSTHTNWKIGQQSIISGLEFTPSTVAGGTTFSTPAMVILNTGEVGIGFTSPAYKLDVNGTLRAYGITDASDVRYKKDIKPLVSVLDNVMKLQGVSYLWRKDEFKELDLASGVQIGIIAQELEKVYPELVNTDSNGYKSVQYGHLTPVLIEAIKELSAEVQRTKAEYQKQIDALQKEVENLKMAGK